MSNIASVLKAEISRIGSREARTETERLQTTVTQQRKELAVLKRQVADLEMGMARVLGVLASELSKDAQIEFSDQLDECEDVVFANGPSEH